MTKYGEREDDDAYDDLEFSVFRLIHKTDREKVELEDSESAEMHELAWNRWLDLFLPVLPSGCLLWGVAVISAVLFGLLNIGGTESVKIAYIPLFLGACFQVAVD